MMKRSMIAGLFGVGVATLVFSVGCAAPAESNDEAVGGTESAIKGGSSDFAHTGVAALLRLRSNGTYAQSCSGTLIAPTVVLTAAHCTYGTPRIPVTFDQNIRPGAAFSVTWGTTASHPSYDPTNSSGDGANDNSDIAVVILDSAVSAPLAALPPANALSSMALSTSTPADVLGYGLDFAIGLGMGGYNDSWERKIAHKFYNAQTQSMVKVNGGDGKACFGDSGGPTFMNVNGRETVVGVNVIGDGSCAGLQFSYRTDTANARSFLASYVTLP
jgi:secreted trypsin-like serine protease